MTRRVRISLQQFLKRCWAEISLNHLEYNWNSIRRRLQPGCRMMAVVKANAYGHGDAVLARYFQEFGADWFAVSNIEEAVTLRKSGATLPILILGMTPCEYAEELSRYDVTQSVYSAAYAGELEAAARRVGVTLSVHVKVDTGMTRIGFSDRDVDEIERVYRSKTLRASGIFTHFACSDEKGEDAQAYTRGQYARFESVCRSLMDRGIEVGLRHCCNSGAILAYPEMQMDMVRPGVILYGLPPSDELRDGADLRPVMTLYSRIAMIKTVESGIPVSYGRTYTTPEPRRIATVACGYADGYPRILSNRAYMLAGGRRAPVIGRVCMDQTMLDVTDCPDAHEGDTVVLAGGEGPAFEELAELAGTIHYELVCNVGRRVPRLYRRAGRITDVVDYQDC